MAPASPPLDPSQRERERVIKGLAYEGLEKLIPCGKKA
jgi:hypothetical protein